LKAYVLHQTDLVENKPLKNEEYPDPVLKEDELLIRISACGVCHSNLHTIEGDWKPIGIPAKLPIVPGHEIVGTVEEVGKVVKEFSVGQRAGVQVLYNTCGHCEYCLSGRENLCLNQDGTGESVDGGFAQYIKVRNEHAYLVPDNLNVVEAAPLFCPGVTAYRGIKRAGVTFGQKIAIFGIGGVGHLSLQFAKMAGAEFIAVDEGQAQLDLARTLEADYVVSPGEVDNLIQKIGKPDVVAIHAPSQKAIDQAFQTVKRGGTVLLAVVGQPFINSFEEYTVLGTEVGTRLDMQQTLRLAERRKIKVKSQAYNMSEVNEVLLKLKKGEMAGRAVLVP
jgi:propanol-preferring alcohol dehydrogenase